MFAGKINLRLGRLVLFSCVGTAAGQPRLKGLCCFGIPFSIHGLVAQQIETLVMDLCVGCAWQDRAGEQCCRSRNILSPMDSSPSPAEP